MGCQISKAEDEKNSDQQSNTEHIATDTMAHKNTAAADYKSRLEWKLCLARDTPEPEFDLSDCNLKDIPSGVFVLCRILLKERLNLQKNKLQSLNGGGILGDLSNLTLINLSFNRFTRVPDEFCNKLKNLRELLLSHNVIDILPEAINKLTNLELLDISYNRLTQIDQIGFMSNLRILNITGNANLTQLPKQLTTCDSLIDIVLDVQYIFYPPIDVIECGTAEILKYLLEHNESHDVNLLNCLNKPTQNIKRTTANMIEIERGQDVVQELNKTNEKHSISTNEKYAREKKFMEHERSELERYSNLEAELHQQQQKRKQNLLQHLLQQQNESDTLIQRMQKEKDSERQKLIDDILQAEANAGMIVDQLISLKSGPDPALLEQEQEEQKQLLECLRINHDDDLRKRDIVAAMTELLEHETKQIEKYNEKRDYTSKTLLEHENNTNQLLDNLFKNNDKDRAIAVSKITQNEELQKVAFTTLIEKNDARTWGLIEQVRIVETQLAAMTNCEIERKKLQMDDQIVDLSEQRVRLTYVLLDLLDQQSKRKTELLDTLVCLESQRENEHQDFWLLQYQKLLDSQPGEQSFRSASIDPMLGYNFLVNGVVHCIPFLSRLWQSDKCNIYDITDNDLIEAGIKNACDREKILQSIRDFLKLEQSIQTTEAIPQEQLTTPDEQSTENDEQSTTEMESECVICMEESCKIIFLPCGHLCCCLNCHTTIDNCPMCRAMIERRIKIIQA